MTDSDKINAFCEKKSGASELAIQLHGETLILCAEKAIYWPARRRLLIADLHLGKDHIFRRAGIALPQGSQQRDLQRLSALIARYQPESLWILGDMLHGHTPDTVIQEWRGWRASVASVDIVIIEGNHDRSLDAEKFGCRSSGDNMEEPPFRFCHHPGSHPPLYTFAGHLHPVVKLPGLPSRWPIFWIQPTQLILPAFSDFTGGVPIRPKTDDTLVVCVKNSVIPIAR